MSSFNVRSRALVSEPVGALQIDNRMGLCLVWWLTQHRWWISAARTAGSFDEFRLASRVPKLYASCSCFSKDNADESPQTVAPPPNSITEPHKHPVEDLDTKTEVILATAVAVLVVFIVTW